MFVGSLRSTRSNTKSFTLTDAAGPAALTFVILLGFLTVCNTMEGAEVQVDISADRFRQRDMLDDQYKLLEGRHAM